MGSVSSSVFFVVPSLTMLKIIYLFASLITVWAQLSPVREYAPPRRLDETPKPYEFSYTAEATGGQSSRQEVGDASGRVVGSYSLSDEDGRHRVVRYEADDGGFRAVVETNEPGTKSENSANVQFYSSAVEGPPPPQRPQTPRPTQPPQEVPPTTVDPYYVRRPYYDRRPHRRPYYDRRPHYLPQAYNPVPNYIPIPI